MGKDTSLDSERGWPIGDSGTDEWHGMALLQGNKANQELQCLLLPLPIDSFQLWNSEVDEMSASELDYINHWWLIQLDWISLTLLTLVNVNRQSIHSYKSPLSYFLMIIIKYHKLNLLPIIPNSIKLLINDSLTLIGMITWMSSSTASYSSWNSNIIMKFKY